MFPDEGRLFLLAQALTPLALLLGFLAGSPRALLAALVALSPQAILDRPHPVQDEFVDFFDDVKDAQLMHGIGPVALPGQSH